LLTFALKLSDKFSFKNLYFQFHFYTVLSFSSFRNKHEGPGVA